MELLASGISINEIVTEELPDLEYEDVVACLYYSITKLAHPVIKAA